MSHAEHKADRYKAALERIARLPHSGGADSQAVARERGRIAREALAPSGQGAPPVNSRALGPRLKSALDKLRQRR